ncbi:MAG: PQQ-binding-like beta-propeller repeat protein, partial [Gemmataceae bacterium]
SIFDERGKYIVKSESVGVVHSLRRPYALKDPTAGVTQSTPSITAVNSLHSLHEMTSLLPRGLAPKTKWVYGSTLRLEYTPLQTPSRLWFTSTSANLTAIWKQDKSPQVSANIPDSTASAPAQSEDTGYFALSDGNLIAIDLNAGSAQTLRTVWRANIGGLMNVAPVVTDKSVFVGGDNSGVARVDRASGEVLWRSQPGYDRLLAINDQFAYIRDRQGHLGVFDVNTVSDGRSRIAYPLATLNTAAFGTALVNNQTDRIVLASDTGLIICMRDAALKYFRPMVVAPQPKAVPKPAVKPDEAEAAPMSATDAKPGDKKPEEKKPDAKKPEEKK